MRQWGALCLGRCYIYQVGGYGGLDQQRHGTGWRRRSLTTPGQPGTAHVVKMQPHLGLCASVLLMAFETKNAAPAATRDACSREQACGIVIADVQKKEIHAELAHFPINSKLN